MASGCVEHNSLAVIRMINKAYQCAESDIGDGSVFFTVRLCKDRQVVFSLFRTIEHELYFELILIRSHLHRAGERAIFRKSYKQHADYLK